MSTSSPSQTTGFEPFWPLHFMLTKIMSFRGETCANLLRPHLESSVVTLGDYKKAIEFSRIETKLKMALVPMIIAGPILGGGLALTRWGIRRKWITTSDAVLARWTWYFVSSESVYEFGSFMWNKQNLDFAKSLEEPEGMRIALTRIRKDMYPLHPPTYPTWVVGRKGRGLLSMDGSDAAVEDQIRWDFKTAGATDPLSSTPISASLPSTSTSDGQDLSQLQQTQDPPTESSMSSWDLIRNSNRKNPADPSRRCNKPDDDDLDDDNDDDDDY